jgi:hypothetical protein
MTGSNRPDPEVRLYQNPWSESIQDDVILQILTTAALEADARIVSWQENGSVNKKGAYAFVMLDPTQPRWQTRIDQRIMAMVLLGKNAEQYIVNGAAKADAHDRHGRHNGDIIQTNSLLLSDGDFAWGDSAAYGGVIGGGSGLLGVQDRHLGEYLLRNIIDPLHELRSAWLTSRRVLNESHDWWNDRNEPGSEYDGILRNKRYRTAK